MQLLFQQHLKQQTTRLFILTAMVFSDCLSTGSDVKRTLRFTEKQVVFVILTIYISISLESEQTYASFNNIGQVYLFTNLLKFKLLQQGQTNYGPRCPPSQYLWPAKYFSAENILFEGMRKSFCCKKLQLGSYLSYNSLLALFSFRIVFSYCKYFLKISAEEDFYLFLADSSIFIIKLACDL